MGDGSESSKKGGGGVANSSEHVGTATVSAVGVVGGPNMTDTGIHDDLSVGVEDRSGEVLSVATATFADDSMGGDVEMGRRSGRREIFEALKACGAFGSITSLRMGTTVPISPIIRKVFDENIWGDPSR